MTKEEYLERRKELTTQLYSLQKQLYNHEKAYAESHAVLRTGQKACVTYSNDDGQIITTTAFCGGILVHDDGEVKHFFYKQKKNGTMSTHRLYNVFKIFSITPIN